MLKLLPPWFVMTSATWGKRQLTTQPSVPFYCLRANMRFWWGLSVSSVSCDKEGRKPRGISNRLFPIRLAASLLVCTTFRLPPTSHQLIKQATSTRGCPLATCCSFTKVFNCCFFVFQTHQLLRHFQRQVHYCCYFWRYSYHLSTYVFGWRKWLVHIRWSGLGKG